MAMARALAGEEHEGLDGLDAPVDPVEHLSGQWFCAAHTYTVT